MNGNEKLLIVVKSVTKEVVYEWLLHKHYAKRKCNIMFKYGLFINGVLSGVITFGMPPTPFFSILFKEFNYLELNRLVTKDGLPSNTLSQFVSKSLKQLRTNGEYILVSYADPNAGHSGYIYQATNWLYTGVGRVNQKDKRGVRKYFYKGIEYHERHIKESMTRLGFSIDLSKTRKENWENNGGTIEAQKRKHRYFYTIGGVKFREKAEGIIKSHFTIYPYPKEINGSGYKTTYKCKKVTLEDIE